MDFIETVTAQLVNWGIDAPNRAVVRRLASAPTPADAARLLHAALDP
jgi:hypothetical protein